MQEDMDWGVSRVRNFIYSQPGEILIVRVFPDTHSGVGNVLQAL
jgi:hypothetical protein